MSPTPRKISRKMTLSKLNRAIRHKISSLGAGRLAAAWVVSALLFLSFDILWSALSTFRSMSFLPTYLWAIAAGAFLAIPTAIAPRRRAFQLILWLVVAGVMIANMMYFRTYFTAIPASAYLMAGNLRDFGSSVVDSLALSDAILIIIPLAGWIWLRHLPDGRRNMKWWAGATALTAILAWLSALPYGGPAAHIRKLSQECYYANCPPAIYTLAGPLAVELSTHSAPLSDAERREVASWLTDHRQRRGMPLDSIPAGKSLVIIFLESFESWPIGLTVEGQEITPFLNSLTADSTVSFFPRLATQVGAGRSIDAQLLMLAGMLPMENEVAAMSRADNRYLSIPEAMKADGAARAYLLSGDKAGVWNQARFARAFSVDTILDASAWEMTEKIGNPPKLADGALFAQTINKMRSGEIFPVGERAYIHIVAYSGHNPWRIPEESRLIDIKGDYPPKYADYLTAMNYVDHALRPLVDYLRSRPDADNIVIAITGDHEGLASYRQAMTTHPATAGIVDPLEHTPLFIINSPRPGRFDIEAGQVDVFPTLLDILALHHFPWRGMGTSILSPSHPGEAIRRDGSGSADSLLIRARHVSDIILRHNILRDSFPD